jgi:hypothetical protein
LPDKVDVVVSDLLGPFSIEVDFWDVIADASARLLKAAGRCIPSAVTLLLAPSESATLRSRLEFLADRPAGFEMAALRTHAQNIAYPMYPSAEDLLATATELARFELPRTDVPSIDVRFTTTCTRAGTLDALVGWFDAELCPGVHMTNAPGAAERLDRQAVALPVWPPLPVAKGERLCVSLRLLVSDRIYRWRVRRDGDATDRREGSTLTGIFIAREDLASFPSDPSR